MRNILILLKFNLKYKKITMFANILLCCFAITLNIKSIESASNRIAPLRLYTQPYGISFVQTVSSLKTFNKHSISIKHADVINLVYGSFGTLLEYQLKIKSLDKLKKKARDIKCSFCVISKSKLLNLKNLFDKLKSGEPFINNGETVTQLKEEAGGILFLLLRGNLETNKWLWIYYLKILAVSQYEENINFLLENPFEDDQLQTGVSDFIENCIADNYLPKNTIESDLVISKPKVYNYMFWVLRHCRIFADILTGQVALVTIEFLYLKPFWDDESEFLFRQIAEVNVDWSNVKQRHEVEVAITREFVENRSWIYRPYDRLYHQLLVMKIIDARFYCYFSVVLHVYEKQFSILDEQTVEYTRKLINNALQDALYLMAFKDDFLVNIVSEFKFGLINDINDIKDILSRVRIKANEILSDLNGVSTTEIQYLSFNVDEDQLLSNDLIIRVLIEFKYYLAELKGFCLPFEYNVFLHFIDVVKSSLAQYI